MPRGPLQRVEHELERIGVLLEHDQELPSVTALVAGEPIAGSWWGHRLGHAIYDLLHELSERSGQLDAKLVNGKITYVHPRLWPAFLAMAQDPDPSRTRGLSPLARELLERVASRGPQRADHLQRDGFAPGKALTAACRELEARVLVHSASLHTESGAHARLLQSWPTWLAGQRVEPTARSKPRARAELAAALAELGRGARRAPKLPW